MRGVGCLGGCFVSFGVIFFWLFHIRYSNCTQKILCCRGRLRFVCAFLLQGKDSREVPHSAVDKSRCGCVFFPHVYERVKTLAVINFINTLGFRVAVVIAISLLHTW